MPCDQKYKRPRVILLLAAVAATGLRRTLRGPASTASSDCELRPIVSLLERLRAPSASELGRK